MGKEKCQMRAKFGLLVFGSYFQHVRNPAKCLNVTCTVWQPVHNCQMCFYSQTVCKYTCYRTFYKQSKSVAKYKQLAKASNAPTYL